MLFIFLFIIKIIIYYLDSDTLYIREAVIGISTVLYSLALIINISIPAGISNLNSPLWLVKNSAAVSLTLIDACAIGAPVAASVITPLISLGLIPLLI